MNKLHWVVALSLGVSISGCKKSAPQNSTGSSGSGSSVAVAVAPKVDAPAIDAHSIGAPAIDAPAGDDPDDENNPRYKAAEALLKDEAIGGVAMQMTDKQVIAVLGKPSKKSAPLTEEATGDITAEWTWRAAGITVLFSNANAQPKVRSITLAVPSALKTKKGVGIGSSRADLDAAYGAGKMQTTDEEAATTYTVGNHYYGMIFNLEGGKVASVYWGLLAF